MLSRAYISIFTLKRVKQIFLFILSLILVSSAQADWSKTSCILAASLGYALFWKSMLFSTSRKKRFLIAMVWFAIASGFHLNWFLSDRYVGIYIYPFFLSLIFWLGAEFGLISLLIRHPEKMGILHILGICGGWTLIEWSRLLILSGYSWDPIGLALSATLPGMQMASAVGIFGLSFWIFFTNLLALRLLCCFSWINFSLWIAIAITPYVFGSIHLNFHSRLMRQEHIHSLSALLVQTALMPEDKFTHKGSRPLLPTEQWKRVLDLLAPYKDQKAELIVLSEGVVPYGTDLPIYPREIVIQTFEKIFEKESYFAPASQEWVGNRFWAQSVTNTFKANLLIGLEDFDRHEGGFHAYNAAFLFHPFSPNVERYEKRILVPMGEYIPFDWCKKILFRYGIVDSFTPGKEAKVFQIAQARAGVSICYEETYGHLMRENRSKGASCLINLTNDAWYPRSRLPFIHFEHGRLRAIETGVPVLRACNTGVTCAIDALGRVLDQLPYDCPETDCTSGVLAIDLPIYHYPTFYMLFGDALVIYTSSFLFAYLLIFLFIKKTDFALKDLNIYRLRKN